MNLLEIIYDERTLIHIERELKLIFFWFAFFPFSAGKNLVKNPGRGNVYIEDANSTK